MKAKTNNIITVGTLITLPAVLYDAFQNYLKYPYLLLGLLGVGIYLGFTYLKELTKKENPEIDIRKTNEESNFKKASRKNLWIFLGLGISIAILLSSICFFYYLKNKQFYYVQVASRTTWDEAYKLTEKYNRIFESNNEEYLKARFIPANNGYMITIRKGFYSRDYANNILERSKKLIGGENPYINIRSQPSLIRKIEYLLYQ